MKMSVLAKNHKNVFFKTIMCKIYGNFPDFDGKFETTSKC